MFTILFLFGSGSWKCSAGVVPDAANDPIVSKNNGSGEPSIYINLNSSTMDRTQLTDYAQRSLEDRFSLITGVSSVNLSGGLYKVMYVKLFPELMAGRSVTTSDIVNALETENVESPGGEVRNDATVMSVRTARLYSQPEDFDYLVVRTGNDGTPIYLKDVAQASNPFFIADAPLERLKNRPASAFN